MPLLLFSWREDNISTSCNIFKMRCLLCEESLCISSRRQINWIFAISNDWCTLMRNTDVISPADSRLIAFYPITCCQTIGRPLCENNVPFSSAAHRPSPSLVRVKMALKACELFQFCCFNMNLWPPWHVYPLQREGSLLCSSRWGFFFCLFGFLSFFF